MLNEYDNGHFEDYLFDVPVFETECVILKTPERNLMIDAKLFDFIRNTKEIIYDTVDVLHTSNNFNLLYTSLYSIDGNSQVTCRTTNEIIDSIENFTFSNSLHSDLISNNNKNDNDNNDNINNTNTNNNNDNIDNNNIKNTNNNDIDNTNNNITDGNNNSNFILTLNQIRELPYWFRDVYQEVLLNFRHLPSAMDRVVYIDENIMLYDDKDVGIVRPLSNYIHISISVKNARKQSCCKNCIDYLKKARLKSKYEKLQNSFILCRINDTPNESGISLFVKLLCLPLHSRLKYFDLSFSIAIIDEGGASIIHEKSYPIKVKKYKAKKDEKDDTVILDF